MPEVNEEGSEAEKARVLQEDSDNPNKAPLFTMILPSSIHNCYVFVVRKKFEQLAINILDELAAFTIFHLELWRDPKQERATLRKWLCKSHLEHTSRYAMVWDEVEMKAVSEHQRNQELQENEEWLHSLVSRPSDDDEFYGTVVVDLKTPAVQDIDNGATVASVVDEMRRLQAVNEDLVEALDELKTEDALLDVQGARIQQLEAQVQKGKPGTKKVSPESHNDMTQDADSGGGSSGKGS